MHIVLNLCVCVCERVRERERERERERREEEEEGGGTYAVTWQQPTPLVPLAHGGYSVLVLSQPS